MRSMGMETAGTQTKVKICGLTRMEDVMCVNQCRPEIGRASCRERV